jgi:hypothetical protein
VVSAGIVVVSGMVVVVVSIVPVVSTGIAVESIAVLSELSDTFFVELHAEVAIIIAPAAARLKIIFFIGL